MRITESNDTITRILDVRKGRIPPGTASCQGRISDGLVYVLSGHAHYSQGSRRFTADAGSILFLSHRSRYDILVDDPNYTYIFANFFFAASEHTSWECEVFRSPRLRALEDSFIRLHKLWNLGSAAEQTQCFSLLYHIYAEIIAAAWNPYAAAGKQEKFLAAVETLRAEFADPQLNIAALIRDTDISEVHFRRLFRQMYRMSPVMYLQQLRIAHAKQLLRDTALDMAAIAESSGFASVTYFSRVFKAAAGMTPSAYRRASKLYYT